MCQCRCITNTNMADSLSLMTVTRQESVSIHYQELLFTLCMSKHYNHRTVSGKFVETNTWELGVPIISIYV